MRRDAAFYIDYSGRNFRGTQLHLAPAALWRQRLDISAYLTQTKDVVQTRCSSPADNITVSLTKSASSQGIKE